MVPAFLAVLAADSQGAGDFTELPTLYPLSSPTPDQWFAPLKGRGKTETRQPTVLTNTTWDEVGRPAAPLLSSLGSRHAL